MVDDKLEPESPRGVGFRTYADDTFRHNTAHDVDDDQHAQQVREPWGQELHIAHNDTPAAAPLAKAKRRGRLGPLAAVASIVCGAAIVGFLVTPSNIRNAATPSGAKSTSDTVLLPLQVGKAPSLRHAEQAPTRLETSTPPPHVVQSDPVSSGAVESERQPGAPEPALPTAQRDVGEPVKSTNPIRVFVHITDAAQRPAADRVRAEIKELNFANQPAATPPVRLVASSPRRTEVRCLKRADCPAASRVARHLEQTLRLPVSVVDMSPTYEGDRRVRAGSLELWLRP